jgi:hypothetical protein
MRTLRFLLPAELDDAGRNAELMRLFCKYYQRYPKATGWMEDVYPDERGWVDLKGNPDKQRKVYYAVIERIMSGPKPDRRLSGITGTRCRTAGRAYLYNLTFNGRLWACVA